MNEKQQRLMKDLAEAKPPCRLSRKEWDESEAARRILAQVMESPLPEKKHPRRWPSRSMYLIWVGAVLVVVLAVFVSLNLVGDRAGEDATPTQPSVASTVIRSGGEPVTVQRALEDLLALAYLRAGSTEVQQPVTSGGNLEETILAEARALGLFGSSTEPGVALSEPVTRAQFVLWLWRVFGSLLPPGETPAFSDLDTLRPEEREAVLGLASAGVLKPYADGSFQGAEALFRAEEAALVTGVEEVLGKADHGGT